MERAGEILRLISQRLVTDLGMVPSSGGPSTFESPTLLIELENREGAAMLRVRRGGDQTCLRFIHVQDERHAALALDWIRRCIETPPALAPRHVSR